MAPNFPKPVRIGDIIQTCYMSNKFYDRPCHYEECHHYVLCNELHEVLDVDCGQAKIDFEDDLFEWIPPSWIRIVERPLQSRLSIIKD